MSMKNRKSYCAPEADVVLLAPCEDLMAFKFHQDDSGHRWGLNGWVDFTNSMGDPSSGITGTGFFENVVNLDDTP